MSTRPKILYLAATPPASVGNGVQMRTAAVLSALQAIGEVECVVIAHEDQVARPSELLPSPAVKRMIGLRAVERRSMWDRLRCATSSRCISFHGHTVAADDREFIFRALPKFDLVWIHHLRTANVFGQWRWANSVMDLDDIPSLFLQSVCNQERRCHRRLAAAWRVRVARQRERWLRDRFDVLAVCSETDRAYLNATQRVHIIPNGFQPPLNEPSYQPVQPPRIGFIGAMDYPPNAAGVSWFVQHCWPRIKQVLPGAQFRIIGRSVPDSLRSAGADIQALGWVADPTAEIASWSLMVVPLQMGAGTRIKVAEGFSRKCPIVSTSLGVHGYEVTHGRELCIADAASDFTDACLRVVRNREETAAMVERAWRLYRERWTWDAIRPRIWAAAEDGLRRRIQN